MRHRLYGGVRGSLCKGALYSIDMQGNQYQIPANEVNDALNDGLKTQ